MTRSNIVDRLRDGMALAVLIATAGLMALIFTVPAPLLYLVDQEYGAWVAQGMSSLPSLGIVVGGPIAGWLGHRAPPRRLLLPALAAYGVLGPMAIFVHSPAALLASRFLLGFAAAIAVAASVSLLSQRFEGTARLKAFGMQGGIASIIGLGSIWLSGGMAAGDNWRSSFTLYGLALILLVLALVSVREQSHDRRAERIGLDAFLTTARSLWGIYVAVVVLFAASFSTGLQLSFKLGDSGIVDPLQQRNVILFASLMNALSSMGFGFIVAQFGARRLFLAAIALMSVGAMLIGLGHTPFSIAVGAAVMGTGSGMVGPYLIGLLTTRVDESERAGAVGIFYSCIFVGEFLNPLFMQPLRQVFGVDQAFLSLAAVLAAITLLAWWLLVVRMPNVSPLR